MKQFISFVRKEFYHIFRDARTTMILLLMPVILIILFGYAITTEIKRVPIAIFDQSRDELTLKMTDRLNASEYFELYTTVDSYEDAGALFRQGKVHVIVVFPPGYASTADAQVQVLADATDPNEATQLIAYCSAIIAEQLKGESAVEGKAVTPVDVKRAEMIRRFQALGVASDAEACETITKILNREVTEPQQIDAIIATCKIVSLAYTDAEGITIVPKGTVVDD